MGLGSYLVNAVASCNDCHSAGPAVEFAPGGNPYFKGNPPTVVNQSVYLGGGRNFGALVPGTPEIVSRNLTPDRTGRPVGGTAYESGGCNSICERVRIWTISIPTALPLSPPIAFRPRSPIQWRFIADHALANLAEPDAARGARDFHYYYSAVPCIAGPATGVLHNDCA